MEEKVNHPAHYNAEGKEECIVYIEKKYDAETVFDACLFNIEKYMYRKGNKTGNSEEQDYQKALWYANYAVELVIQKKIISPKKLGQLIELQAELLKYIEDKKTKEKVSVSYGR